MKKKINGIVISLMAISLWCYSVPAMALKKKKVDETHTSQFARQKAAKKTVRRAAIAEPSVGQMAGLHHVPDMLNLSAGAVLVVDQNTREVLLQKNDAMVLPIASITKLMGAVILGEANPNWDEKIVINAEDVKNSGSSRLKEGTIITRRDLQHIALMSSENRAAYALGRSYPGGVGEFVRHMNEKALVLNMTSTRYVEPTGLSSDNRSNAQDLAKLVAFASTNASLRKFSTSPQFQLTIGQKSLKYLNTNHLTSNAAWDIGIQKTGYIAAAGRCLVMQTKVDGRDLIMVFLDALGKKARLEDAQRVKEWVVTAKQ